MMAGGKSYCSAVPKKSIWRICITFFFHSSASCNWGRGLEHRIALPKFFFFQQLWSLIEEDPPPISTRALVPSTRQRRCQVQRPHTHTHPNVRVERLVEMYSLLPCGLYIHLTKAEGVKVSEWLGKDEDIGGRRGRWPFEYRLKLSISNGLIWGCVQSNWRWSPFGAKEGNFFVQPGRREADDA